MKKLSYLYPLFVLLLLFPFNIRGQFITPNLLSTSGDVFTKINASMEWSIGEICTETFKTPHLIMTQGLHQGEYLFYNINETSKNLQINIFPNPTTGLVNILIEGYDNPIIIKLYDIFGKQLFEELFIKEYKIDLSNYSDGLYVIQISSTDLPIKRIFKIEKINY